MLRVRTVTTGVAGSPWYTNLFFNGTNQAAADDAQGAVADFYSLCADVISTACQMTVDSEVPVIDPATGQITSVFTTPGGVTISGTATGDLMPAATAALLRYKTGVYASGRQIQGRSFIGGMVEPNSTALGRPSGAVMSELAGNAQSFFVDGTPTLVVWSRARGVQAAVAQVTGWTEWASIRSHRD